MGDLGEEFALGHRHGLRFDIVGVQQALEHHPAVADIAVDRQIDPAQPTVREATLDFVLPGDHIAGAQTRPEVEMGAAVRAIPAGGRRSARTRPAHRVPASPAEPFPFRDHRIGQDRCSRVGGFDARDLDQPGHQRAHGGPGTHGPGTAPRPHLAAAAPARPETGPGA